MRSPERAGPRNPDPIGSLRPSAAPVDCNSTQIVQCAANRRRGYGATTSKTNGAVRTEPERCSWNHTL